MSFRDLLEVVILESYNIPDAVDQAHTNPLGIWWYNRDDRKLVYSVYQGQSHDRKVEGEGVTRVRGRLFNDKHTSKNAIIVWTDWHPTNPTLRLTRDEVEYIAKEVQRQSGLVASSIVNEYGDNISESIKGVTIQ